MSKIIIIEGPNCVGKTTLSKYLSDKLMIPIYEHITDQHRWVRSDDGFMEFLTLYNMGKYHGLNLICDRGLFSFQYYNPEWRRVDIVLDWFDALGDWDDARIVCMMSSYDNLIKNANKKSKEEYQHEGVQTEELTWFSENYSEIPKQFKVECNITDYESIWKEKVLEEVRYGG